jgi:hypothetical protein
MLPNVAIVYRPSGPITSSSSSTHGVADPNTRRRVELAAEARRLARRRLIADAVARRSRENDRALPGDASTRLSVRARRKATRLGLVFHRAIEALWIAGDFDEALAIFREHKTEHARHASRLVRSN